MERYKNLGGDSGVAAYEIGTDSITVQFRDGWFYTYTNQSAGVNNIVQMKSLATSGHGLNSFIKQSVNKSYDSKFRR